MELLLSGPQYRLFPYSVAVIADAVGFERRVLQLGRGGSDLGVHEAV